MRNRSANRLIMTSVNPAAGTALRSDAGISPALAAFAETLDPCFPSTVKATYHLWRSRLKLHVQLACPGADRRRLMAAAGQRRHFAIIYIALVLESALGCYLQLFLPKAKSTVFEK